MRLLLYVVLTIGAATPGVSECFEAFVVDYPKCRGYAEGGYMCQAGWCVSGGCLGDCTLCAEEKVGMVPDYAKGRCVDEVSGEPEVNAQGLGYEGYLGLAVVVAIGYSLATGAVVIPLLFAMSAISSYTPYAYLSPHIVIFTLTFCVSKVLSTSLQALGTLMLLVVGVLLGFASFIYVEKTYPMPMSMLRVWFG